MGGQRTEQQKTIGKTMFQHGPFIDIRPVCPASWLRLGVPPQPTKIHQSAHGYSETRSRKPHHTRSCTIRCKRICFDTTKSTPQSYVRCRNIALVPADCKRHPIATYRKGTWASSSAACLSYDTCHTRRSPGHDHCQDKQYHRKQGWDPHPSQED